MRLRPLTAPTLALTVLCAACAAPTTTPRSADDPTIAAEPTWKHDVLPLLTARCGTCHTGDQPAAGLDVTRWKSLIAGSDYGEAVIAFDPEHSLLIELGHRLPAVLPAGYRWRWATPYDTFREAHRLDPQEIETLRRWVSEGARSEEGDVPFADPDGRVFVAIQDAGMVSVIDVDRHVVARNVHFGQYGGRAATPHDTAFEPDGSAWYVTLIGAQRVVRLDARTNEVIADLDVAALNPTLRPGMLALDAHSDRLYLSRSISDISGGRSIMVVERTAMEADEVLVPFTRPHPIGITPDGRYVLTGSLADNLVAAIDTRTFDITRPLRVDGSETPLMHYDVAPDGRTAAITGQFSNLLYLLDITDPERLSVAHSVPVGQEPWYPAYTHDGRRVIVPNHRGNSISIVDVGTATVVHTIEDERFAMPHDAVASPDGRYLFVSNANLTHDDHQPGAHDPDHHHHHPKSYQPRFPLDRSGDGVADNLQTGHVAVIDARTYEVLRIIELEDFPSGMSLWQRSAARP